MTTENHWAQSDITPARIDAIIRQARAERADVMRAAAIEFSGLLKRLVASFRPIRERVPHKGAWA